MSRFYSEYLQREKSVSRIYFILMRKTQATTSNMSEFLFPTSDFIADKKFSHHEGSQWMKTTLIINACR